MLESLASSHIATNQCKGKNRASCNVCRKDHYKGSNEILRIRKVLVLHGEKSQKKTQANHRRHFNRVITKKVFQVSRVGRITTKIATKRYEEENTSHFQHLTMLSQGRRISNTTRGSVVKNNCSEVFMSVSFCVSIREQNNKYNHAN